MPPPTPAETPTSLDAARREREDALRRDAPSAATTPGTDDGQAYVAADDVLALLNRIGECVRALPSFGRTRTQTAAVVAKRTLSAISTCSASRLADDDDLRPVLARLAATRGALRGAATTGTERIAIARWLGQLDIPGDGDGADGSDANGNGNGHGDGEERLERGLPVSSYVLCGGQVIRQPGDHHAGDDDLPESHEERIDDLARAGALIAAEIDRLQQLGERRYA